MENAKRLEALEAKRKQLDAQIQALRVREQTQARKDDTRRKVLMGGVMLKRVKLDEMPEGRLTHLLDKHLDAERDRKLFGLEAKLFFFQAEDGIRDDLVTGVQTCALPI